MKVGVCLCISHFCLRSRANLGLELLDPNLVVNRFTLLPGEDVPVRVRGVRLDGDLGGDTSMHIDVYDSESGQLRDIAPEMKAMMLPHLQEKLSVESTSSSWRASWKNWQVGVHPAVHCQSDDQFTVAGELRSGKFIYSLFATLYSEFADFPWTRAGINIGAGMSGEGDDDPLLPWTQKLASKVLLVDPDVERLEQALMISRSTEVEGRSSEVEPILLPVNASLTPVDAESGSFAETLANEFGNGIDALKIDIDSFDCALLQAILRIAEPVVLIVESQSLIPPPIKFARVFHPLDDLQGGLLGCSLSYQIRMLYPAYELLLYTNHDTVFVHSSLAPRLERLQPGAVFYWTHFPLKFPVNEFDCFRRSACQSAFNLVHQALTSDVVEIDTFLREWTFQLDPIDSFTRVVANFTFAPLVSNVNGQRVERPFTYAFDL
eukprot:TRINITY_DN73363_c0_g1_i1.p1 TRINITY_DN73363_c0_g1~~TRINITY_DN73363_c0_g1_i1.p1  ORF type:complete len:435 (-),score=45.53 TRINITY_DN73363_c0_g1_i1:11-1315(-)